jgi:hypothetical protein
MEETMKCLKNTKTNNIIRVSDIQAYQMAGNQWKYVSKSEWKGVREPEVVDTNTEVSNEIPTEKKKKKSKSVS